MKDMLIQNQKKCHVPVLLCAIFLSGNNTRQVYSKWTKTHYICMFSDHISEHV